MALLNVLRFPDERLRLQASEITSFDAPLQQLIDDMMETMYDQQGVGLAATQINVQQRLICIDVSTSRDEPLVLINPVISQSQGLVVNEEGCLSVPGTYASVERAETIQVTALDRHGEAITLDADGLLAICIQHEIDHLNGILFIDYLSPLKRQRIRKKLEKEAKKSALKGN